MPEIEAPEALEQEQPESQAVTEAAEPETEEQQQESKPKDGGFQRKIDKLTRRNYELAGANSELRERLSKLEERISALPQQTAKQEAEDPEPALEQFKTYEEWVKAVGRWTARQEAKALVAKERETQTKAEQDAQDRETVENYRERVREFAKEHDDFDDVVANIKLRESLAAPVQLCLLEDENGPALAYYLGENPEVVSHLNGMSEREAMRYLGRLSERLFPEGEEEDEPEEEAEESEPAEKQQNPSPKTAKVQAPAPIKPVKKPSPTSTALRDEDSIETWMNKREKQLHRT